MGTIHSRIKQRRQELGLSQTQLAEACGVKYQTVQQWEKDPDPDNPKTLSTAPSRRRMPKVADALGVTEEWLRTGTSDNHEALDPIELQLVSLYRRLPNAAQELLVQQANGLYTALNPGEASAANPFAGKKPGRSGKGEER